MGAAIGVAKVVGATPKVVAAPHRPPSPMSIFLLSNLPLASPSWAVSGFWSSFLVTLHEIFRMACRVWHLERQNCDVLGKKGGFEVSVVVVEMVAVIIRVSDAIVVVG